MMYEIEQSNEVFIIFVYQFHWTLQLYKREKKEEIISGKCCGRIRNYQIKRTKEKEVRTCRSIFNTQITSSVASTDPHST